MSAWDDAAFYSLPAEQRAKAAAVRGRVLREAAAGKPFCTTCGVECPNRQELEAHAAAHGQAGLPAVCAICGLRFEDCKKRNVHEHNLHNFHRDGIDREKNGAVSVAKGQLAAVENVGFLFGSIQATAAPSSSCSFSPAATGREIEEKMFRSTGVQSAFACYVCHLRFLHVCHRRGHEVNHEKGAEFKCSVCQQLAMSAELRNGHEALAHACERPRETRHWKEAVRIPKELHSELLSVGMNFAAIQERASSPPVHSAVRLLERTERDALERPAGAWAISTAALIERIWARFITAPPAVLFFDHQEFAPLCGELPLFRWAADPRCKLLLLRSATVEWRQEPRALENFVFLRLPLAASFVLCFCKVSGARLAARLVAPAANCRSFGELMEVVAASGESAIVVARPEERSAIRHLDTGDFVVL